MIDLPQSQMLIRFSHVFRNWLAWWERRNHTDQHGIAAYCLTLLYFVIWYEKAVYSVYNDGWRLWERSPFSAELMKNANTNGSANFQLPDCVLVHKCLHGIAPSYLLSEFRHAHLFHGYNTRSRDLLRPPFAKTTKYQGSFRINGARTYNTLPRIIRQAKTLSEFKFELKRHFKK